MNKKINLKFVQICFTALLFATPLLFCTQTHDQFELPKLVFVALLALPLLLLSLTSQQNPFSQPLSIVLLVFILSQGLSCLPTISLSWTTSLWGDYENFSGFYTLLTYLAWYLLFVQFLTSNLIRRSFYFIVLAAFLSSLYAIGQHFQFDFVAWNPNTVNSSREFAALGNPNFLSAYIAMAIPFFLHLTFEKKENEPSQKPFLSILYLFLLVLGVGLLLLSTAKGQMAFSLPTSAIFSSTIRILGLFCLCLFFFHATRPQTPAFRIIVGGVLLLGLFSTASRGGFLAAFSGTILWFALSLTNREIQDRWKTFWANVPKLQLTTLVLALGLFTLYFGWSFLQRLGDSILHVPQSLAASRSYIWKPAWDIFLSHPWFGIGLDTFKIAFPRYSGIEFNQMDGLFTSSRMAHNEWLQIAATTGLIGFTAYLLLLGTLVWTILRAYRNASPDKKGLLIALGVSAFAYQVQNFFSFGVAALNLVWFFVLSSVVILKREQEMDSTSKKSLYFKNIITVSLVFLMLLFPLKRLAADIAFEKADVYSNFLNNHSSQTSTTELDYYSAAQVKNMERAQALFAQDVKYTLYTGLAYEQRGRAVPQETANALDNALRNYERAIALSPCNAYYYSDEGRIFTTFAQADPRYWSAAEKAYEQAVHYSPSSPYFLLSWVVTLEKTGKSEEANEETRQAFNIDPTFSAKVLSQIAFNEYRQGDRINAFDHIEKTIELAPSNPEALYCRGLFYLQEKQGKKALSDFEKVRSLHPDDFHDPSIQNLDQLIQACKVKD